MPYAEDYNLTIQREVAKSTVATLAFVGTQGHKLISQYDANPGNAALCLQLNQEGATSPSGSCGPYREQQTFTLPNGQQVQGTRTTLGPAFGANNSITANIANSNYASFQASLEQKTSDLTFLAAYTYSKAIDDASGFNDWVNFTNYRLSRSLASFDLTHNFVVSYNWAIPFAKGLSKLPKRVTTGWQLSGISRFSTGFPVGIHQSQGDFSLTGSPNTDTPDLIAPVTFSNPKNTDMNGLHTYFRRVRFASEQLGMFGTANRAFFHGPGILNTDLSLEKVTHITESTSIELRAEFFNTFNHTQFNGPSGDFSSATFGAVTSARDPRIGQLSVKFLW